MGPIEFHLILGKKKFFSFSIFFLVALLMIFGIYTIGDGTIGVVKTLGKIEPKLKKPGVHLKVPFMQKVRILDITTKTTRIYTQKGLKNFDLIVQYHPITSRAPEIISQYGENYLETCITPKIKELIQTFQQQEEESQELEQKLEVLFQEEFASYPFEIKLLQLSRKSFIEK